MKNGVDLGNLELRAGSLVTGRVLTHDGKPVSGGTLLMEISKGASSFLPSVALPVGRSGPDGWFRLEHVPPTRLDDDRLFAASSLGIGHAILLTAHTIPEVNGIEIRLEAPGVVEVQVELPDGEPLKDAAVAVLPVRTPFVYGDWSRQRWPPSLGPAFHPRLDEISSLFTGTTDASGLARFHHLPAGFPHTILVNAEGRVHFRRPFVRVTAEQPVHVTVTLQPVVSRSIAGIVRTPEGRPTPGLGVQLYHHYQSTWTQVEQETTSDERGRYSFDDLPPASEWHLVVDAEGYARRPFWVRIPDDDNAETDLVAEPGFRLEGIVTDETGTPVAGVRANLQREGLDLLHRIGFNSIGERAYAMEVQTGVDGRFVIPAAAAGEWRLSLGLPGNQEWEGGPWFHVPVRPEQGHVEVQVRHHLPGHVELIVEVVDDRDGVPVEPNTVAAAIRPEGGEESDFRTIKLARLGEGRFRRDNVNPGEGRVAVSCEGRPPADQEFIIEPWQGRVVVEVRVPRYGTVEGRVYLDGLPLPERNMRIYVDRNAVPVDAAGRVIPKMIRACPVQDGSTFRFAQVEPGPISFSLYGEGLAGMSSTTIESGVHHEVEIHAVAAGELLIERPTGWPRGTLNLHLSGSLRKTKIQLLHSFVEERSQKPILKPWPVGEVEYSFLWTASDALMPEDQDWEVVAKGILHIEPRKKTVLPAPDPP